MKSEKNNNVDSLTKLVGLVENQNRRIEELLRKEEELLEILRNLANECRKNVKQKEQKEQEFGSETLLPTKIWAGGDIW